MHVDLLHESDVLGNQLRWEPAIVTDIAAAFGAFVLAASVPPAGLGAPRRHQAQASSAGISSSGPNTMASRAVHSHHCPSVT